jgi:transaldolase
MTKTKSVSELRVQVFADGADKASMLELYRQPYIKGFTTNPTLMRKAGVTDYERFAREILQKIPDRPISFEVFADDEVEMERQARKIARWAGNVYVKIPVTNTRSEPMYNLIRRLSAEGIQINATAVLALDQVRHIAQALKGGAPSYISVFAGRVADTGRDPIPLMKSALEVMAPEPNCQLVWASPRELLNIFQADEIGCHIITVTSDVLKKINLVGKDLHEYSLETVRMFHNDAAHSGYKLELTPEAIRDDRPVGSLSS